VTSLDVQDSSKQQIKANRNQTSVNMKNQAFGESILTPSTNYHQFLPCPVPKKNNSSIVHSDKLGYQ